jgi:hypothetical protein
MQPAPQFYLTAIGAARVVGGPPGSAAPLLLLFHDHAGAERAHQINVAMRVHFPDIQHLQIASVVGLHHIPRFMRMTVEQTVFAAYRHAADAIPAGLDPADFVLIVPDWEGKVSNTFGMDDCHAQVGVVLIVNPWRIFESYRGDDPSSAALRMVLAATNRTADSAVEPGARP